MTGLTDEQRLAVESIDRNVLVSAGAGSGKTHVLVERYIEILRRQPELMVSNLVAVTYTTKAANEMRSRLKARIQELFAASSGEQRTRWMECLAAVDGARIGTIHSLCESVLRAFPVEAAIDPRFEVLSDLERAELLNESFELAIHEVVPDQSEPYELLLSFPVEQIRTWVNAFIGSILQFHEAEERLVGLTDDQLEAHCRQLMDLQYRRVLDTIRSDMRLPGLFAYLEDHPMPQAEKLDGYRRSVLSLSLPLRNAGPAKAGLDDRAQLRRNVLDLFEVCDLKVGVAGGNSEQAKELRAVIRTLKELIQEEMQSVPGDVGEVDLLSFRLLRGLLTLAKSVLSRYQEAKQAGMRLDFNDLIWAAFQVLVKDGSQARKFFNESIAAVLVDEFQDTNRLQAKLISLLSGERTRLFLIGDDKQSIYKFQGADVSIFNEWRGLLGGGDVADRPVRFSGGGLLINLSKSFRSHPALVGFVNSVFERLFQEASADATAPIPYKARFQPLAPHRQDSSNNERVELVLFDAHDEAGERQSDEAKRVEAQTVAAWIAEKVLRGDSIFDKASGEERPIKFGNFAVLVQHNREFRTLEDALSAVGIPFVTLAASGFLKRQEIYDLESVLRFLWSPADSHALIGALRSPMFGIGDDLLHSLKFEYGGALWSAVKLASRENPGGSPELERAARILSTLLELSASAPLSELVRRIITSTNYDIVLMAVPGGKQRSRNLWKLASLAGEYSQLSIKEFVSVLDDMRELNVKQSNAPLDAGDSVKLMTIHGSKGLEFPAVALPFLAADIFGKPRKVLFHREYGVAFDITRDVKDQKPALYLASRWLEQDMEKAERKRLLYVAMTRPRDYLAMFMEIGAPNKESFRKWLSAVLAIDVDNHTTEDGLLQLRGSGGLTSYRVRSMVRPEIVDCCAELRRKLSDRAEQEARNQRDEPGGAAGESLDMVAPLVLEAVDVKSSWQELLRVTPAKSDEGLEPTIAGTFFHEAMQHYSRQLEPLSNATLVELAGGHGIGIVHAGRLQQLLKDGQELLDRFRDSELFSLMLTARKRIHEAPYTLADSSGNVTVGRPDLLLQSHSGEWYVIDYKTDHFKIEEIDSQVRRHREQLANYVEHIERLTGVRAKPALYFAQHGLLKEISS